MQHSCGACLCRQHTQVAQSCHDVASSTAQRPWLAVNAPNKTPLQCPWTHTFRRLHAQMPQQIAATQSAVVTVSTPPAHCHQDSLQPVSHQHKACCRCICSHTDLYEAQKSFQALNPSTLHCVLPEDSTLCVTRVQFSVSHQNTYMYMYVARAHVSECASLEYMQVHMCHHDDASICVEGWSADLPGHTAGGHS